MERNTNAVISTNKLCKSYMNGEVPQHVIKNMDIQIFYKDFTVFMGPSRFRKVNFTPYPVRDGQCKHGGGLL